MLEIIPTILTSDLDDFSRKIESLKGLVPRVQIDIVDGKFALNKTIDLSAFKEIAYDSGLKIDLHLMVEEPFGWINRCLEIVPDRIIAQIEKMKEPFDFVNEVIESGAQVGLAVDLETPVDIVSEDIYLLSDMVLLLGVKAGAGGQEFAPKVLDKIAKIREILGESGKIGVDGGINGKNIKDCREAGANIFYVGNYFWQAEDLGERYNELLSLVNDDR